MSANSTLPARVTRTASMMLVGVPQSMMSSSKSKPLPLSDTLRDLALLRASDINLSTVLAQRLPTVSASTSTTDSESSELSNSTEMSYDFVRETRGALRVYNSGELQRKHTEIQKVHGELDEVLKGLS